MKFLVDNQLPKALAKHLQARGHDCLHVLDVELAESSDADICRYALMEERILVSKDEDFVFLATRPNSGIKLIWVRLGNCRTTELLSAFDSFLPAIESHIAAGDRIVELR